jgi:hypothetical protein
MTITANPQAAKPAPANSDAASCRKSVQDFYDWYVPITIAQDDRFTVMLRPRKNSFDPKLWQMLAADDEAQSKAHEIVGLDFDPIVNSQDPSPKFKVHAISIERNRCNAVVYGFAQGTREERVAPELIYLNNRWIFVNFHYQFEINGKWRDSDLVAILEDLRKSRAAADIEKPK